MPDCRSGLGRAALAAALLGITGAAWSADPSEAAEPMPQQAALDGQSGLTRAESTTATPRLDRLEAAIGQLRDRLRGLLEEAPPGDADTVAPRPPGLDARVVEVAAERDRALAEVARLHAEVEQAHQAQAATRKEIERLRQQLAVRDVRDRERPAAPERLIGAALAETKAPAEAGDADPELAGARRRIAELTVALATAEAGQRMAESELEALRALTDAKIKAFMAGK